MPGLNFTPLDLHKAERAFAETHGFSQNVLEEIHKLRQRCGRDLPSVHQRVAVWLVAPVLAGFAKWMTRQAGPQSQFLGVMREGRTLCRLMQSLFDIPAKEVWLNRNLSMLAAFGVGDDEALVNWLVRTRIEPLTQAQALQQLLRKPYDDVDGPILITIDNFCELLNQWKKSGSLDRARMHAAAITDRMLRHWDGVVTADAPVYLMDFACAGNIQRSLQTVFTAKKYRTNLAGLNFAMTAGSQWAEKSGCVMHGYLSERGQPEWFAQAYARTPELIEIFTAAPLGPLKDYGENGEPVTGTSFLIPAQQELIESIQMQMIEAATFYHRELGEMLTPDIARCIWGRLLLHPLRAEAQALGDWPLDAGLDGNERRVLAPILTGTSVPAKMQTAWPSASRMR